MSLIRPLTRGLVEPINRSLLGARLVGDALSPAVKALFASGEKGVMFDLTRSANLYTDSARTTLVTASGDGVGSCTDLSPNGKHASSIGSARPTWNSAGYATFDAFDDYLQTAAIDFSGTDAVTIVASLRKLTNVGQIVAELSAAIATNAGSFYLVVHDSSREWASASRGSAAFAVAQTAYDATIAPDTAVITATHNIAGDLSRLWRNGVQGTDGNADKGTGNFGNYPLYLGARGGSSVFFNGRIYRLLIIGRVLTTTERAAAERWAAQPVGITIP